MFDPTGKKYSCKADAAEQKYCKNGEEVFFCSVLFAGEGQREKKAHAIFLIVHGDAHGAENSPHKS